MTPQEILQEHKTLLLAWQEWATTACESMISHGLLPEDFFRVERFRCAPYKGWYLPARNDQFEQLFTFGIQKILTAEAMLKELPRQLREILPTEYHDHRLCNWEGIQCQWNFVEKPISGSYVVGWAWAKSASSNMAIIRSDGICRDGNGGETVIPVLRDVCTLGGKIVALAPPAICLGIDL